MAGRLNFIRFLNSIVYQPKNLYEHRPLPHLIGSKDWHEKWHIGLIDEESDGSDNESQVSITSSSGESISSNVPVSLSEAENPIGILTKKLSDVKLSGDIHLKHSLNTLISSQNDNNQFLTLNPTDSQDLFESSSEENLSRSPHGSIENSTAYHKQSLETSKQIKAALDSREIKSNNSIFMPQKPITTIHTIPTLIDSDPPELDDDVPTIKNVQKPTNLFLDDENDVDDFNIFNDKTTKGAKQTTQHAKESDHKPIRTPSQTKSINLFADDDDDDNFDSFLPTKSINTISATPQKPSTKLTNLFEDDDDFDDELFLPTSEPTTAQKPVTSILSNAPKKSVFLCNLFSDEPPEDDFDVIVSPTAAPPPPQPSTSKDVEQKSKTVAGPAKVTNVSSAVESQPKKTTTDLFSNKINLFDDEEEDDPFDKLIATGKNDKSEQKNSSKIDFDSENIKPERNDSKEQSPTNQSSKKTNLFNPVNLFNDPTLDDDELFTSITSPKKSADVSKQNTGEFYNDFSDTITVAKLATTIVEENVQHSEKKITSPSEPKKCAVSEIDGSTSGKVSSELLKKIDAISNPNVKKDETPTAARQPKKLNIAHMDINVNALLPGAKRTPPSKKSDDSMKDSLDDANVAEPETIKTTVSNAVNEDNVDSSGRLINLNRNRPKNLSRRPSTRAGRRQQYQKSLEDEQTSHATTESTDKVDSLSDSKDNIPSPQISKMVEDTTSNENPSPETDSTSRYVSIEEELFESDSPPEDDVVTPKEEAAIVESDVPEKIEPIDEQPPENEKIVPENENSFSFLDEEENDDFLDFSSTAPPKPAANSAPFIKATPAYIDELPPELDLPEEISQSDKSKNTTSFLSENALSLFDDDDEDDYNDALFSSSNPQPNPSGMRFFIFYHS